MLMLLSTEWGSFFCRGRGRGRGEGECSVFMSNPRCGTCRSGTLAAGCSKTRRILGCWLGPRIEDTGSSQTASQSNNSNNTIRQNSLSPALVAFACMVRIQNWPGPAWPWRRRPSVGRSAPKGEPTQFQIGVRMRKCAGFLSGDCYREAHEIK